MLVGAEALGNKEKESLNNLGIGNVVFKYSRSDLGKLPIRVYMGKEWGMKFKSITHWGVTDAGAHHFLDIELHILTFVDIWDMKRQGTWQAYVE